MRVVFCVVVFSQFLLSCNSTPADLKGNWSVFDIEFEGKDISGIDKTKIAWMAETMIIESRKILTFSDVGRFYCYFEVIEKDGQTFVVIEDCKDPRFNGTHKMTLEVLNVFNKGRSRKLSLVLESEKFYLRAEANR